jgi:quercetin dioxygenase-like cupin family protein
MTDTHAMTTTPLTHGFTRRPGAGSSRAYFGHLFSFLAESGQTNGGLAVMEVTVRKGLEPPPHTHSHEDETYYVLDGRWIFDIGGESFAAEPGSLVYLPRRVAHSFSIDDDAARALVILTPGGLEDAFRELSEPTAQAHGLPPRPDGPPPIARMAEVFGAHGIEFGPGRTS